MFLLPLPVSHIFSHIGSNKKRKALMSLCELSTSCFLHIGLEYGSIIIPSCLPYTPSTRLFCQKDKNEAPTDHRYVGKLAHDHASVHAQSH